MDKSNSKSISRRTTATRSRRRPRRKPGAAICAALAELPASFTEFGAIAAEALEEAIEEATAQQRAGHSETDDTFALRAQGVRIRSIAPHTDPDQVAQLLRLWCDVGGCRDLALILRDLRGRLRFLRDDMQEFG